MNKGMLRSAQPTSQFSTYPIQNIEIPYQPIFRYWIDASQHVKLKFVMSTMVKYTIFFQLCAIPPIHQPYYSRTRTPRTRPARWWRTPTRPSSTPTTCSPPARGPRLPASRPRLATPTSTQTLDISNYLLFYTWNFNLPYIENPIKYFHLLFHFCINESNFFESKKHLRNCNTFHFWNVQKMLFMSI